MSLYERLRRAYVAIQVFRGMRDDPIAELEQSLRTESALRGVLDRTQAERQYWYDLWFQHSREYHNAQSQLINEINEQRQKLGIPGADKLHELEKRAETQRHSRLVEPKTHPVSGIKTELKTIEVPSVAQTVNPSITVNGGAGKPFPKPKGTVKKATPNKDPKKRTVKKPTQTGKGR